MRRHLTPSLVVSLLALGVASSGTAFAAGLVGGEDIRNNSVASADIKNNSLTSADIKNGRIAFGDLNAGARKKATADEKDLWAQVAADGTIVAGNQVVAVTAAGGGFYFVQFERATTRSPVGVTLVSDGAGDGQVNFRHCGPGTTSLNCSTGGTDESFVFVNTEDSTGANVDKPFLITVGPAATTVEQPGALRHAPRRGGSVEGGR